MTAIETFDKRYAFMYRNIETDQTRKSDDIISDALEGIAFYMVNGDDSTISLYDAQDDTEPVFTGSVDEMAEYINEMSDDYHTFDDEIRSIVPR